MSCLPLLSLDGCILWVIGKHRILTEGAVDVYRNKVGSTMAAGGHQVSTVAPHLQTRIGKKMWVERKSKRARGSKRADTP